MTPHWTQISDDPPVDAGGAVFMDAVLTPNRSLSRLGFARLMAGFALLNMLVSVIFVAQGAYPIAAFLALDVAVLFWAFRVNYVDGRAQERVRVAADRVHVTRRSPQGRQAHWIVSPLWAQVEAEDRAVRIVSAGKGLRVGAFLSPQERQEFSAALSAALAQARRAGYRPSTSAIP